VTRYATRPEYNAARENYQNDLREQEAKALGQLADEREAAYLYERLYCLYVMHEMTERKQEITAIYDRLVGLQQKPDITVDCINSIIRAQCVVLDHRNQYTQALGLTKSLIAQWEKNPWRIKDMQDKYVKLLGNFMIFTSRTATYEELPGLIHKLEQIEPTEKEVAKDVFYLLSFCRIYRHLVQKEYQVLLAMIPEVEARLREYDLLLSFVQKRTMYTIICLIYFKNKMYPKVLDAVQDVYALVGRDKEKQHRIEDIRVYEFVSHYEMGNTELLHYTIRNNQRFFKEHQPENDFIVNMWKLLKQLVQSTDKPKIAKQKIKIEVEALSCPDVNSALQRELIAWLEGA
jgi:hypothetical protein